MGLCLLLATACGDGEGPKAPKDTGLDPVEVERDAELSDAAGEPAAGEGDGGASTDAGALVTDAGDVAASADAAPVGSGTLLDLPDDGNALSICHSDAECNGDELACHGAFTMVPGFCTERCKSDRDCSPIAGLEAGCSPAGLCRVDCSGKSEEGDGACPANMVCRDFFDPTLVAGGQESAPGLVTIWRCSYPAHSGSNRVKLYERCNLDHGSGDCEQDLLCHAPRGLGAPTNPGYCTQGCKSEADCTSPSGTSAVSVCTAGACELDCLAAGATCPSGMNCRQVGGPITQVYRCRFIAEPAP